MGAGFGVGQSMVVIAEVEAAIGGDCIKLVVRKELEKTFGRKTCAMELVVRVIHLIATKNRLEATLVKRFVVRDQRQALNKWFYLRPDFRKHRGIVGVLVTKPVDPLAPVIVVIGLRLDERIKKYQLFVRLAQRPRRPNTRLYARY